MMPCEQAPRVVQLGRQTLIEACHRSTRLTTVPRRSLGTNRENTTTAQVAARSEDFSATFGRECARNTTMPLRKPPQVSSGRVPRANLSNRTADGCQPCEGYQRFGPRHQPAAGRMEPRRESFQPDPQEPD